MRLSATTPGWLIVCIIVDSFLRIFSALDESLSLAMIFKADFSFVTRFLTFKTTPKAPTPSKSLTLNISVKLLSSYLSTSPPFFYRKAIDRPSSAASGGPISFINTLKLSFIFYGVCSESLIDLLGDLSSSSLSSPSIFRQSMFSRSLRIFLICFDLTRFLVGEISFGFKSLYGFYWIVICADEALYFLGLLCAEATSRKT